METRQAIKHQVVLNGNGLKSMYAYEICQKEIRARICNGCGAAGWKYDLVPDTVYGLSIKEACNIHDWMYHFGVTLDDKKTADEVFLWNMETLVNRGFWMLKTVRLARVNGYYLAVKHLGERAFLEGKEGQNKVVLTAADLESKHINKEIAGRLRKRLESKIETV